MDADRWLEKHRRRFPHLHPKVDPTMRHMQMRAYTARSEARRHQQTLRLVRKYFQERPGPVRDAMENEILRRLFK